VRERSIIMNGSEVQTTLSGLKTQKRIVVKPQPPNEDFTVSHFCDWEQHECCSGIKSVKFSRPFEQQGRWDWWPIGYKKIKCPYGQPGDRLWVRETFADEHPNAIQPGRYSQVGRAGIPGPPGVQYRTIYRADGGEPLQVWRNETNEHPYFTLTRPKDVEFPTIRSNFTRGGKGIHWTPSIHMPRWASRITLEIVSVRVERLQDISEEDVKAEGVLSFGDRWKNYVTERESSGINGAVKSARLSFESLWESISGPGSWELNQFVWVIEYKKDKS